MVPVSLFSLLCLTYPNQLYTASPQFTGAPQTLIIYFHWLNHICPNTLTKIIFLLQHFDIILFFQLFHWLLLKFRLHITITKPRTTLSSLYCLLHPTPCLHATFHCTSVPPRLPTSSAHKNILTCLVSSCPYSECFSWIQLVFPTLYT